MDHNKKIRIETKEFFLKDQPDEKITKFVQEERKKELGKFLKNHNLSEHLTQGQLFEKGFILQWEKELDTSNPLMVRETGEFILCKIIDSKSYTMDIEVSKRSNGH